MKTFRHVSNILVHIRLSFVELHVTDGLAVGHVCLL